MEKILFPHNEIRKTQDDFINDVLNSLQDKKHLLAHAPTGIGKTAILGPILAFALKNNLDIFFLTSRHTQHKIAIETLKLIKSKYDSKLKVSDIIGRKFMCCQPGIETLTSQQFQDYCHEVREKETCSYYNNCKEQLETKVFLEKIKNEILHVEELTKLASQKNFCPYEIAMLKAKSSNIIIADYYHIFSPSIRELFFKKTQKSLQNSIIIIDEAHNLPKRIRNLLTSSLSTLTLTRALKEAEPYPEIKQRIEILQNTLLALESSEEEHLVSQNEFQFDPEIIAEFEIIADEIREEKKHSYIGSIANFLNAWLGSDKGFTRIFKKSLFKEKEIFTLTYTCLDPSIATKEVVDSSYFTLGMSGTLTPLDMYSDLLGFRNINLKQYSNPFPSKNRLNLIIPETSTKFTKRSLGMFQDIAKKCSEIVNEIPGNSLVFFPSYKLRDDIYVYFSTLCKKTTFLEIPGLTKLEKENLLENFKSYKDKGSVLLAVFGGNFSEGIDLPGDLLKSVIIVGLPLSPPDLETKELINYYDEKFNRGWDYGYIFPAMQKVIQSAGRCIRSENDRGVIIFLDERYSLENYKRCFPQDMSMHITKLPLKYIQDFFSK